MTTDSEEAPNAAMKPDAVLRISSKNYSSWSLRGWLLTRLSGLDFTVEVATGDEQTRAELLLRASSIRIPCLIHGEVTVWDTLAIAEYLNELRPEAQMFPADRVARAYCRSISGEMHSGFEALRASLPMNLRAHRPGFALWSGPKADIVHILTIWKDCLGRYGGPWLFGERRTVADAMYAPVVTRFLTYDVPLEPWARAFCERVMEWPDMAEWVASARQEPEPLIEELEVEAEF